jgi:hypothetical protein
MQLLRTGLSCAHGLSRRVYVSESGHGKLIVYVVTPWVSEISYPVSWTEQ